MDGLDRTAEDARCERREDSKERLCGKESLSSVSCSWRDRDGLMREMADGQVCLDGNGACRDMARPRLWRRTARHVK